MTFEPWVLSIILLALAAAALWFWFMVWRTPMRLMLAVTVRYRARRLLDFFAAFRQTAGERFRTEAARTYEELFDTILVLKELDRFYQPEIEGKFSDIPDRDGKTPAQDFAECFAAQTPHALCAVAVSLFEQGFGAESDSRKIFEFLMAERRLMEHDEKRVLDHPERLWRRFGKGPIRGWRTRIVIQN